MTIPVSIIITTEMSVYLGKYLEIQLDNHFISPLETLERIIINFIRTHSTTFREALHHAGFELVGMKRINDKSLNITNKHILYCDAGLDSIEKHLMTISLAKFWSLSDIMYCDVNYTKLDTLIISSKHTKHDIIILDMLASEYVSYKHLINNIRLHNSYINNSMICGDLNNRYIVIQHDNLFNDDRALYDILMTTEEQFRKDVIRDLVFDDNLESYAGVGVKYKSLTDLPPFSFHYIKDGLFYNLKDLLILRNKDNIHTDMKKIQSLTSIYNFIEL